jgi:hypothetical protein
MAVIIILITIGICVYMDVIMGIKDPALYFIIGYFLRVVVEFLSRGIEDEKKS